MEKYHSNEVRKGVSRALFTWSVSLRLFDGEISSLHVRRVHTSVTVVDLAVLQKTG